MADKEDTKKEEQKQAEAQNVATLSLPTIIAALHQNALAHSDAASKGARIANSAIDGDGDKAKIASAGEHIISVLPIDSKKPLEKKVAVEVLKQYVQWFVGPDLASKVNDSTVKPLSEAPGNENAKKEEQKKPEEKKGDDEFSQDEDLKESHKFMSFKQFLLEAEGEDEFSSDKGLDEPKDDDKAEDKKDEFSSDDDLPSDEQTADESKESTLGYYIPYSLKVQGLPQTALKDAMKKFAATFFDDVTIKASGLFGGGDSFTVKDVKDAFKNVFGPINPDELEDNVRKEITSIKHPYTDVDIKIRDKKTLIPDLGNNINGTQKKKIDSADYSLWIKIGKDDPKKPIFNPRVVADIVTSSVKGLFKKFKNKITKDDVILIQNYHDTHEDTEALNQLINSIPEPSKIASTIKQASNIPDAWQKIDKPFDTIRKNKQYKNSKFASAVVKLWTDFKDKHEKDDARTNVEKGLEPKNREKYFKEFTDKYTEIYDKNKPKTNSLNESYFSSIISPIIAKNMNMQFDADYANIKDGIMSILFESYDSILLEGKLDDYIADNKLTKEQALSGETFKAIKALIKQGDEKTKDAIEKAFAKIEAAETASDEQTSNEEISVEANENPSENEDIRADLYIIPMPGLKYKDKEYDTNA